MAWPMRAGIHCFMPLNGGGEIPLIIVKHFSHIFGDWSERLITKLILNPTLVGTERNNERVKLIDTFMEEYGDFTNKRGMFARGNILIMAADENVKAYWWHFKYSLPTIKVLGKLACLVLSKILGIGTAERNWKQVEAVKSGQRVNTGINKTKKQVWSLHSTNTNRHAHRRGWPG
jgi:hypothetical protein